MVLDVQVVRRVVDVESVLWQSCNVSTLCEGVDGQVPKSWVVKPVA